MARTPQNKSKGADADERSPAETERIREATLKRILSTPPKRHADMLAERKAKRARPASEKKNDPHL
jgi:hypothetical protein